MDDFLTDDFIMKLIRLGVLLPEHRLEIRKVLETLHEKRLEAGLERPPDSEESD